MLLTPLALIGRTCRSESFRKSSIRVKFSSAKNCVVLGFTLCAQRPSTSAFSIDLGGKDKIPTFPTQPAAIHFVAYDYVKPFGDVPKGSIVPLGVIEEHCTTVYKVQEAFSAVSLPEGNVYGNAIKKCLYGE